MTTLFIVQITIIKSYGMTLHTLWANFSWLERWCWKRRGDEAENRARAGVGTHNGCLSYSNKLIICFNVINRSRVYRHYFVYTLFSKTYLRWGLHFEPFKYLHHSHMNNTVNSFDVSIVQFILYLTYRIKITVIYTYWNTTYQTYTKMQVYRVK